MAGPWEKYQKQAVSATPEVSAQGPWTKYQNTPTATEVLSGEDPLMEGLDANRREDDERLPNFSESRQTEGLSTYDELYGGVEKKYEREAQLNRDRKAPLEDTVRTQLDISDAAKREKEDIYNRTGRQGSLFEDTWAEGSFIDPSIRIQMERKNNPDYDPSDPESQRFVEKKFLVPSPDDNAVRRFIFQVGENIVGGVGDLVTEGKLLTEGSIGKQLPDQVAGSGTEEVLTELTTFIVGPQAISKGIKLVGNAAKSGAVAGVAQKAAQALSPEAQTAVRNTYDMVYKATGSAQKALQAANAKSRMALTGLAFGLKEATVAPDGSEGMLVDEETIQQVFGVSHERAKDISFMLDTPVISGTLQVMGGIGQAVMNSAVKPAVGGLRNINVLGTNAGMAATQGAGMIVPGVRITQNGAGLRVLEWLDPNIAKDGPESFVARVRMLSGAMDRNATKDLRLGKAATELEIDTPAAFAEIARDYYTSAYPALKDVYGTKEFNDWVSSQSAEAGNKLFELKTALIGDPTLQTKTSKTALDIEGLVNEASGNTPEGVLLDQQTRAGQTLGDEYQRTMSGADAMETQAKTKMDASQEAVDNAISSDPEVKKLFDDYVNTSGSTAEVDKRLKETVSEPLYQSFKKMKTETDEAYDALAKTGAQGDANSILEIIGKEGVDDPFFKRIAESVNSDDSFGNIYNNIKNRVSNEIGLISKSGNDPMNRLEKLYALRDNIRKDQLEFLKANGDDDVVRLTEDALNKFVELNSAWYKGNLIEVETLARREGKARLAGENMPVPEGAPLQGVGRWDQSAINTVLSGLDGPTGDNFRTYIERAATSGGQDISSGLGEYYMSKSLNNIASRIAQGGKEDIKTLRQGIGGMMNILDNMKSPLLPRVKALEAKIQTLENVATADKSAYDTILKEADEIRKQSGNEVLGKFIYDGQNIAAGDVDGVMKRIFNGPKSSSELNALLNKADSLGDEGVVVKEALQGTYLDHLKGKMFSGRTTGIGDISNEGDLLKGYKANENSLRKILEPNSKEMNNLRILFKDTPEVYDQFRDVAKSLQNTTRTTVKNDDLLKGAIDKQDDPSHAFGTTVQLVFGVLNPTATKIKRIGSPIAARNLEEVKKAQSATVMAMLTDPKKFAEIIRKVSAGVEAEASRRELTNLIIRGAARTATTDVDDEMENLR